MLRKDENNRTSVRHYARPTFAYRNESDEIEEVREEPAVNCPLASTTTSSCFSVRWKHMGRGDPTGRRRKVC